RAGRRCHAGAGAGGRAAPARRRRPGRAVRRRAGGAAARRHVLVLPVPRVVLPARHARAALPAAALAAVYGVAVTVGPTADVSVNDLFLYRSMTSLVAAGQVPYHDWQFEYPPLAIVPIALGGVFGNDEATYAVTFALLML